MFLILILCWDSSTWRDVIAIPGKNLLFILSVQKLFLHPYASDLTVQHFFMWMLSFHMDSLKQTQRVEKPKEKNIFFLIFLSSWSTILPSLYLLIKKSKDDCPWPWIRNYWEYMYTAQSRAIQMPSYVCINENEWCNYTLSLHLSWFLMMHKADQD